MAKELVKYVKGVEPGSAFTAGLLHDIGKRFLSSFVADDFKKIMMKVVQDGCSFVEAEKEVVGMLVESGARTCGFGIETSSWRLLLLLLMSEP